MAAGARPGLRSGVPGLPLRFAAALVLRQCHVHHDGGARATGKTVYIAVLIKQLQRFAARLNREVFPANDETVRRFRDEYETPLFTERGICSRRLVPPCMAVTSTIRSSSISANGRVGGVTWSSATSRGRTSGR